MIGQILAILLGTTIPDSYMIADGRCLPFTEFQQLSELLHEGSYWPYGECFGGFKLPDLRGSVGITNNSVLESVWIIKVK